MYCCYLIAGKNLFCISRKSTIVTWMKYEKKKKVNLMKLILNKLNTNRAILYMCTYIPM